MIEKLFYNYKEATIRIIDGINNGEDMTPYFEYREKMLKEINNLNYDGNILRNEYIGQGIDKLDKELQELLSKEENLLKDKIRESKVRRAAYSSYASVNRNSNLFSRRV